MEREVPMLSPVNVPVLGACALLAPLLGWLWYGPLFGTLWRRLGGTPPPAPGWRAALESHLFGLFAALVQAAVLDALLTLSGGAGWRFGLALGATCGIGLVATSLYALDRLERRPFNLSCINAGYRIVWFAAAGAILGAWA
jgi:hypothetical protein